MFVSLSVEWKLTLFFYRKKRKWDQPAESFVSAGIAIPGISLAVNGILGTTLPSAATLSGTLLTNPVTTNFISPLQLVQSPAAPQSAAAVPKLNQVMFLCALVRFYFQNMYTNLFGCLLSLQYVHCSSHYTISLVLSYMQIIHFMIPEIPCIPAKDSRWVDSTRNCNKWCRTNHSLQTYKTSNTGWGELWSNTDAFSFKKKKSLVCYECHLYFNSYADSEMHWRCCYNKVCMQICALLKKVYYSAHSVFLIILLCSIFLEASTILQTNCQTVRSRCIYIYLRVPMYVVSVDS